jgi:hypothetical protein
MATTKNPTLRLTANITCECGGVRYTDSKGDIVEHYNKKTAAEIVHGKLGEYYTRPIIEADDTPASYDPADMVN